MGFYSTCSKRGTFQAPTQPSTSGQNTSFELNSSKIGRVVRPLRRYTKGNKPGPVCLIEPLVRFFHSLIKLTGFLDYPVFQVGKLSIFRDLMDNF